MWKQGLEEAVHPDHASEDAVDSEILARNVEKGRIQILYLDHIVNHVESGLKQLLVGQLLLDVEEVIEQLGDISNCVGQSDYPIWDILVAGGQTCFWVAEESGCFEDVAFVFGVVEDGEGFVVVFDVPVQLDAHLFEL